jgi:hypothetical protein
VEIVADFTKKYYFLLCKTKKKHMSEILCGESEIYAERISE